ncbi:hypothetical protein Athai_38080 [Actinocatenispora thailandica]|uniref:HTH marR-type domain-containing protein n=1 Tax=Actinocatenispora thailandica TaxID=227318 RepID=A0A7R7DRJ7_9ACTN|nr:MarR family transcriptional regulator [Actinocatenispora thailandica]BCJ36305.1 hypothetical protein Athai_38080 [Actinocatenispora thailandica]
MDNDPALLPERLRSMPSRLLAQAGGYAQRTSADALAAFGLRQHHYALLAALAEFGPASQSALSDRTGVYRSDLVGALNELGERGLVSRSPDPGDRRRNVVSISAAGRQQLRRLDTALRQAQERLLAPLAAADRQRLLELLGRLLAGREH